MNLTISKATAERALSAVEYRIQLLQDQVGDASRFAPNSLQDLLRQGLDNDKLARDELVAVINAYDHERSPDLGSSPECSRSSADADGS